MLSTKQNVHLMNHVELKQMWPSVTKTRVETYRKKCFAFENNINNVSIVTSQAPNSFSHNIQIFNIFSPALNVYAQTPNH